MGFLILNQWRITIPVYKLYWKRRLGYRSRRVADTVSEICTDSA